jgi:hypothetical protein
LAGSAAAPYELGFIGLTLYPVYLRGEAYLAAHQGSAASAEIQKILDHACVVWNEPIGALAHLQRTADNGERSTCETPFQRKGPPVIGDLELRHF